MTAICPSGHSSSTADYCDQCGAPIAAVATPQQPTVELPVLEETETSPSELREPCPKCGAPRSGDDRYCESCGHDFLAPPPAAIGLGGGGRAPTGRSSSGCETDGIVFPTDYRERRFALDAPQMRIGRRRGRAAEPAPGDRPCGRSRGSGRLPPARDARAPLSTVAMRSAILARRTGRRSTTTPLRYSQDTAVPLADGDRIRIGAWTTITVRRR